jgi:DNA-binding LacI/PurR family transcriptional regulator
MSSIREVAKRANVSIATVSRTINNPDSVERRTAERVRQAIGELRYYPNTHARSLVSGKSRTLGLIVSDITNPFFPELIQCFDDLATAEGYDIVLSSTNYDSERMARSVRKMIERQVEGVAVLTSEMDQHLIDELGRRRMPSVFLDVGSPGELISNIQVDYATGVSEAIHYLLDLGHHRVGLIAGPDTLKSARARRASYLDALKQAGIEPEPELIVNGGHTILGGFAAMTELLTHGNPPTAVLASNDLSAIGGLRAVQKRGLKVPGHISIVGFDDILLAEFTDPPLTTIRLSRRELANQALGALLRHVRNDSEDFREGREYVVSTRLVIRESTERASGQADGSAIEITASGPRLPITC